MQDFKNIIKIMGILLFLFAWFFYWFRLYETDDDVKQRIIKEETPKSYDFRIVSCKDYRGFNFVGVDSANDTISCKVEIYWDLRDKYHIGDRIVKSKGSRILYLIKPNEDTVTVHLCHNRDYL